MVGAYRLGLLDIYIIIRKKHISLLGGALMIDTLDDR